MRIRNNSSVRICVGSKSKTVQSMKKNLEKLSSGFRINRAADDAAGLSVSEKIRANITETSRCQDNVREGLDLTRTADGALAEINDMLRRAKELCLEAENSTYSEQERKSISDELNALFDEIDRITASSRHNTITLFRETEEQYPVVGTMPLCTGRETVALTLNTTQAESPTAAECFAAENVLLASARSSDDATLGEIDFIQDRPFDPAAPPAKRASVTFELT